VDVFVTDTTTLFVDFVFVTNTLYGATVLLPKKLDGFNLTLNVASAKNVVLLPSNAVHIQVVAF